MRIGIYGGTFNPIHYGHLRTAEEVAGTLHLDRIIFIPAGKTPFDKPDLEKASYRYKMVKTAIEGNPLFKISAIETGARSKSYTIETIKKLRDKYKKSGLFFILGIDAFLDLPLWKQPERLIGLTNIVVISRPGYHFSGISGSPYLKDVPGNILRKLDKGTKEIFSFDISGKQKAYLMNVTALNISASYIRDLVKAGKNVSYLLPESVKSYIISNTLYKRSDK